MYSTYLFDLDDTLIDTKIYAEIYPAILQLIKEKGFDIDEEAKKFNIPKEPHGRYDSGDLCRELGLLNEYYKILEEKIKVINVLHESVKEIFDQIKGKKIGIVSNSMRKTIDLYLKKYGITIDFVFSQDDARCKKNKEEFWKKLIEKEKLVPNECLVIGDNPLDDDEIPKKRGFNTLLIKSLEEVKTLIN